MQALVLVGSPVLWLLALVCTGCSMPTTEVEPDCIEGLLGGGVSGETCAGPSSSASGNGERGGSAGSSTSLEPEGSLTRDPAADSAGRSTPESAPDCHPITFSAAPPQGCNPDALRNGCASDPSSYGCTVANLYASCGSIPTLAAALGVDLTSEADLVHIVFPETVGRALVDEPPTAATNSVVQSYKNFAPYELTFPMNWAVDPYGNNSWRLYLQNLSWVYSLLRDEDTLDTAAVAITDWVSQVPFANVPLEWTWGDHAMSSRLLVTLAFVDAYVARKATLNQQALAAAARLVLTHLYALASEDCYTPAHNHGAMQDRSLMRACSRLASLPDSAQLWELASDRFLTQQLAPSISKDGIHVENSPGYHLLYAEMLPEFVELYVNQSREVPRELEDGLSALLAGLPHLLQPNGTFAQFGDTENKMYSKDALELVAAIRALPEELRTRFEPWLLTLQSVVSDNGLSHPPREADRVFPAGGYAAFRSQWGMPPADTVVAHLSSEKLSRVHYHQDETTFEVFGFGKELIVDSGLYSYQRGDPLANYQKSPAAHNILVLDNAPFDVSGDSGIQTHGGSGGTVWVRAFHDHYASLGAEPIIRTFAYQRPNVFAIIDSVTSVNTHEAVEHLHLHPDLNDVAVDGSVAIAKGTGATAPTLSVASFVPGATWKLAKGVMGKRPQGWWFPSFRVSKKTFDLMLHCKVRAGRSLDIAYLIVLTPPSEAAPALSNLVLKRSPTQYVLSWDLEDERQSLALPLP